MTDARPGQADAHDALAVRRAPAGFYRTKVVVFVLNAGSQDELLMTLSPWAWPPDGCCRTKVVFSCVLLFMTDARPGQADAHDALAVRRASAGYYRTKEVVFVFDDDSQDELMRMMLEP